MIWMPIKPISFSMAAVCLPTKNCPNFLTPLLPDLLKFCRSRNIWALLARAKTQAGYLFATMEKLVAALWALDDKKGPSVNFEGAKTYDYFANPLDKTTVELGMAPVFAVGVSENSRWFRQAAYSLESQHLISVTAGDTVTANLEVQNARPLAIAGKVRLQLPTGWTDNSGETNINVAAGQTANSP